MTKISYINELPYEYDPDNRNSHYLINGSTHHKNGGELAECIAKFYRGLFVSDINPSVAFDKGSDIESENASVKSSGASLARGLRGTTANELIKDFFARDCSEKYIYIVIHDDSQQIDEYHMNKREYGAFIQQFAYLHYESKTHAPKINLRNTSKKMIIWFEERCN